MRYLAIITMTFMLSGCGHSALKAPCGPAASLGNAPCVHIPVNVAQAQQTQLSS